MMAAICSPAARADLIFCLGIGNVEVEILRPAIDQERRCAEVTHHFRRRGKGHRWHDDGLPRLEPIASSARCKAAVQELTAMACLCRR